MMVDVYLPPADDAAGPFYGGILINPHVITGDEAGWSRTMREMGAVLRSEDAKEGPRAFAEKRAPVWKAQ